MTMPLFGGRTTPALDLLGRVAEALGPLVDRVVFIGGAIAPLLQTHPVSPRVRPTKDVDGVAITASYSDFHILQEQLRTRGFVQRAKEADTSRHAHRWTTPTGILFDLVPAGTHLGGSGSPLDQVAVDTAVAIALHTSNRAAMVIRHADAPTFLALKWAAFEDRGGGDLLGSHDVEDILAVVASRPSLPSECASAPERVQTVLRAMASTLMASEDTLGEVLQAHVVVDHGHDQSQVHLFARDHLRLLAALRNFRV